MTITEFLTARVNEDEAHANAMRHFTVHEQPYYSCAGSLTEPLGDLPWGEEYCDCFLAERKARVLREVAAKREILARHAPAHPVGQWIGCQQCDDSVAQAWPCPDACAVAAVYSDHPDYQPEWAVTS